MGMQFLAIRSSPVGHSKSFHAQKQLAFLASLSPEGHDNLSQYAISIPRSLGHYQSFLDQKQIAFLVLEQSVCVAIRLSSEGQNERSLEKRDAQPCTPRPWTECVATYFNE